MLWYPTSFERPISIDTFLHLWVLEEAAMTASALYYRHEKVFADISRLDLLAWKPAFPAALNSTIHKRRSTCLYLNSGGIRLVQAQFTSPSLSRISLLVYA